MTAALRALRSSPLFSNGGWSLLNHLARVASLALVMIALSRHFGPQQFGSLAFGLAFVRVFAVVAAFGLDRIFVQHLVQSPELRDTIVRKGFFLKVWIAMASYVVMLAIAFAVDRRDHLTLCIIALAGTALLFQCFDVFDFAFQAQGRFRIVFFGRAVPLSAFAGVKVAAVLLDAPLLTFAALEALEAMAIATVLFCLYRRSREERSGTPDDDRIRRRQLLARGFPIFLTSISVMIYMRSDILILGKMVGYKAAGIYSAAAQITEACTLLPMAFVPALFPFLVRWRKQGERFYHDQLQKLFSGAALTGFCVTTTLALSAPFLVQLLYGAEYAVAARILVIHAWAGLFIYVAAMQNGYDIIEGLSWLTVIRTAAGAVLNVGLNLALVPRYGGAGSAFATLLSQIFSGVVLNLVHPRTRVIFAMQIRALLLVPFLTMLVRQFRRSAHMIPPEVLPAQHELGEV